MKAFSLKRTSHLLYLRMTCFAGLAAVRRVAAENDGTDTRSYVPGVPAGGLYFVVRGVTFACGTGTYDEGVASQSGGRDAEIAAGAACP